MGIRADLKTFLGADATISGLVGTHIHWQRKPAKDANAHCIAFAFTGSENGHDLDGAGGWDDREVIINCRSTDPLKPEQIADAVRTRMKGFSGAVGNTTALSIMLLDEWDDYDEPKDNSGDGQYIIGQRYFFKRKET